MSRALLDAKKFKISYMYTSDEVCSLVKTFFGNTDKHGRLALSQRHARPVESSPVIRTQ